MRENNVPVKLLELSKRAAAMKTDPSLRHVPNEHDINIVSENTRLVQLYQYQTINAESDDI